MRIGSILAIIFTIVGCSSPGADSPDHFGFEGGRKLAEIKDKKIVEASGIAASINNPGLLWTHNDSGNDANIFLIDEKLNLRLECKLQDVENRDWEDIAVGPGPEPGKNYVYVGDIGDNLGRYEYKVIYRFEEPVYKEGEGDIVIRSIDKIVFNLPDERKDAETLLVDPLTKDLFVISKREKPVVVYRIAASLKEPDTVSAEIVGTVKYKNIVGGDISSDGKEILLKSLKNVYYWKVKGSIGETLQTQPMVLPYKQEPQGEAIAFSRDGSGYYTISEKITGEKSYLQFYKRKNKVVQSE